MAWQWQIKCQTSGSISVLRTLATYELPCGHWKLVQLRRRQRHGHQLLAKVKCREPDAWRRLVELYALLIYRWCRSAGLQPTDAADVSQEVFIR